MRGDVHQVAGPDAGGQQRLVGVPEGGVGDRDGLLLAERLREALRAEFEQALTGAGLWVVELLGCQLRQLLAGDDLGARLAVGLVDRDAGQVGEQLGRPVGRLVRVQQVGTLVDERRGDASGLEVGVGEHGPQEADVGVDAADAELGERPLGAADGRVEVASPAGQLDHHRVEVGADLGAGEHRAAVEPDARPARGPVHLHRAGVGPEAVGRVLGGDPALQRGAAGVDVLLPQAQVFERLAGGDAQLRADEVDVGDLLGHRVLDLDPRVHLHEGEARSPGRADGVR